MPAPAYSLANYRNGRKLLEHEGLPANGAMIYNAGVIFFALKPEIVRLLEAWAELSTRLEAMSGSDQLLFSIALQARGIDPIALSPNFNYRGFGDRIIGAVRIWHSTDRLPASLNRFPWMHRRVVRGMMRAWNGTRLIPLPYWPRGLLRGPSKRPRS